MWAFIGYTVLACHGSFSVQNFSTVANIIITSARLIFIYDICQMKGQPMGRYFLPLSKTLRLKGCFSFYFPCTSFYMQPHMAKPLPICFGIKLDKITAQMTRPSGIRIAYMLSRIKNSYCPYISQKWEITLYGKVKQL